MKKQKYNAIWRTPEETTYGFPKLMVGDNCQSGSINIRDTRLSLWAIISTVINGGWDDVERSWFLEKSYGYSSQDLSQFLYCLLEQRGEFGRLLLVLANAERQNDDGWWGKASTRHRVMKQLQRCLAALNQIEDKISL